MTIRRLIYFSDRAAGLLGTISSSTVNAAIEKAYGAPAPAQDERLRAAFMEGYQQGIDSEFSDPEAAWNRSRTIHLALDLEQARPAQTEQQPVMFANAKELAERNESPCCDWSATAYCTVPLYAAPIAQTAPQPEQSGLVLPHAQLERIERRLTDWLELNCCECESGHSCGRNEVTADRDAIRAALSAHVSVPECVRNWFDAKLAHVEAVDAYNTRLAFIRKHMPFGASPDPEYQIMEAADRKVRELNQAMFFELRALLNGGEA